MSSFPFIATNLNMSKQYEICHSHKSPGEKRKANFQNMYVIGFTSDSDVQENIGIISQP
jgi:hypothetical protein